jgi:hypothetical protein
MERDETWLRMLVEEYFEPDSHPDLPLDDDEPFPLSKEERRGSVISQVLRLVDESPEQCWRFIEIACDMPLKPDQLGLLGAGFFEDLMDDHGPQFIDRVEAAAKHSRSMRAVVDTAWTNNPMDQNVMRAIKSIQKSPRPRG